MTEQLKTLMDRAAHQDFAAVDLDAITGAGDRTVKRRRVATGVAGVAVLAVVATSAVLLGGDGDRKADFVDDPFRTDVPMWTEGGTLHTPDQNFDLGIDVLSFVRTSDGVVFTGIEGEETLGVYSYAGRGEPTRIGETDDPNLRADADEPYVGWLDRSTDEDLAVVYDQGRGERVWSRPARVEHSFPIVAIDGARVYLADADEAPTDVLDLTSGEVTELPDVGRDRFFLDADGEVTAYLLENVGGADLGIEVVRPGADPIEIQDQFATRGALAPGGRWISVAGEDLSVHDTTTGEAVDIGAADALQGYGYEWVDADTLMVLAEATDADTFRLLSCEVPDGRCAELMVIDDYDRMYAVGSSDLLWGLVGGAQVETESSASPVSTETVTIEPE